MGSKVSSSSIAVVAVAANNSNNNNDNNNTKAAVVRHATFITGGWGEFGPKIYSFHASGDLLTYSGKGRLEASLNDGKCAMSEHDSKESLRIRAEF